MKVAKFGGSSVADAGQFKKVKAIVEADERRQVVVVSAAGKWKDQTVKVTDLLIRVYQLRQSGEDFQPVFAQVKARLLAIKEELGLSVNIESKLEKISNEIPGATYDYIVSRGEFLTGMMMADYLGFKFVDPQDFMIFDGNEVDLVASNQALANYYHVGERILVPGFYGRDEQGNVHLMPRGGSDITGSILANLLNANLYENWTDVSGIKVADPNIIDHSRKIDELTYAELQELSYMGISVFQEEAIQPSRDKNIPIAVLNTNAPEEGGTLVASSVVSSSNQLVTGIAGKKGYVIISIKKHQLSRRMDIIQEALKVVAQFGVEYNYLPSGTDAFSLLVKFDGSMGQLNSIVTAIKDAVEVDEIELQRDVALVAAVSANLSEHPALAGRILELLDKSNIKVQMVVQEGADIKLVIGVANEDYEKTIAELYKNINKAATSSIEVVGV
ncbi:aspartate kinase [Lentilactobacillus sp. Marseille-Q4993]|uniref:aspartate kinase n=1 Tax=Lentilactobacillus sp. Marseille-Q4993 TaxID=3039492 RepID=UPI0024BC6297|nr:aspartate kinase [Lentilactobacillus sp. Marseille-Q4993]